jgi:hypothetical protein
VSPLKLGILITAVIAGPPLYGAVQEGGLQEGTALGRAGLIAFACMLGVVVVRRVVDHYHAEQREARQAREAQETADALTAVLQAMKDDEAAAASARPPRRDGSG